jgi:hypothetical protein
LLDVADSLWSPSVGGELHVESSVIKFLSSNTAHFCLKKSQSIYIN